MVVASAANRSRRGSSRRWRIRVIFPLVRRAARAGRALAPGLRPERHSRARDSAGEPGGRGRVRRAGRRRNRDCTERRHFRGRAVRPASTPRPRPPANPIDSGPRRASSRPKPGRAPLGPRPRARPIPGRPGRAVAPDAEVLENVRRVRSGLPGALEEGEAVARSPGIGQREAQQSQRRRVGVGGVGLEQRDGLVRVPVRGESAGSLAQDREAGRALVDGRLGPALHGGFVAASLGDLDQGLIRAPRVIPANARRQPLGLVELSFLDQHLRQLQEDRRVGITGDGAAQRGDRVVEMTEVKLGAGHERERFDHSRVVGEQLLKLRQGALGVPLGVGLDRILESSEGAHAIARIGQRAARGVGVGAQVAERGELGDGLGVRRRRVLGRPIELGGARRLGARRNSVSAERDRGARADPARGRRARVAVRRSLRSADRRGRRADSSRASGADTRSRYRSVNGRDPAATEDRPAVHRGIGLLPDQTEQRRREVDEADRAREDFAASGLAGKLTIDGTRTVSS